MSSERIPVTVRLTPEGLAEIDRLADAEDRDRSGMIRVLLREATQARQKAKR
jgi:predicted transcriptional regulator